MSLIQVKDVILSSGNESKFKLECDKFIEENLEGLVFLIRSMVGPFHSIEGVPRGGLRLLQALLPFRDLAADITGKHLIIDDVLTTGGSMERIYQARKKCWPWGPEGTPAPEIVGVVVFARGQTPPWIKALFTLDSSLWML